MKSGSSLVIFLFVSLTVCRVVAPTFCEWAALALMICAGIPHGSFDLRVAEAKWRGEPFSRKNIVAAYLACVIGMGGLCVFYPFIGISLFLVISALHFSEGEANSTAPPSLVMGSAFGTSSIILPIGLHTSQAQTYMSYFVPTDIFLSLESPLKIISYSVACVLGFLLLTAMRYKQETTQAETFQRLLCLCAWVILPPLSGFAVWFIGRHSRQHLEACQEMFARSRFGVPLDFALISALAITGLLPFTLLFDFSRIEDLFAASICLIAGLTLPHMLVSHRMNEVVGLRRSSYF
jgi:Brp/Blh family beta-carotene 15,15'-monooxygenase